MAIMDKTLFPLPLHIDTKNNVHYIRTDELTSLINNIKEGFADINSQAFNGQVKYEFVVRGINKGSVEIEIALLAFAAGNLIDSDMAHEFIKKLTGYEYDQKELAGNAGKLLHDIGCLVFSKTADAVRKAIPKGINLGKALNAKNKFYTTCAKSDLICGISFSADKDADLKIEKRDFPHYIVPNSELRIEPEEEVVDVVIVRSVNVNQTKKWDVRADNNKRDIKVLMEDEYFNKEFLSGSGRYPLKATSDDDKMTVMLEKRFEYKYGRKAPKEFAITKVYKFNDQEISPVPENLRKPKIRQVSLFDFDNGEQK